MVKNASLPVRACPLAYKKLYCFGTLWDVESKIGSLYTVSVLFLVSEKQTKMLSQKCLKWWLNEIFYSKFHTNQYLYKKYLYCTKITQSFLSQQYLVYASRINNNGSYYVSFPTKHLAYFPNDNSIFFSVVKHLKKLLFCQILKY